MLNYQTEKKEDNNHKIENQIDGIRTNGQNVIKIV